jgi:myo-inositol-1(or 4)-monophosphatase
MASLKGEELDEIYAFAIELGKQAGKILLDAAKLRYGPAASRTENHVEKLNAVDLVTQTDEDVEAFIKDSIAERYPQHKSAEPSITARTSLT